MKLSQLKKATYEEIKNKQYEKLRETMGEDIELYFKESGQFIGYQEMEMDYLKGRGSFLQLQEQLLLIHQY